LDTFLPSRQHLYSPTQGGSKEAKLLKTHLFSTLYTVK